MLKDKSTVAKKPANLSTKDTLKPKPLVKNISS